MTNNAAIRRLIDDIRNAKPHIEALQSAAINGDSAAYALIQALERTAHEMVENMFYDRNAYEYLCRETGASAKLAPSA